MKTQPRVRGSAFSVQPRACCRSRGSHGCGLLLLLLCAFCFLPTRPASADTPTLLYQWDFNGTPGTTVSPTVGSGGVLSMSKVNVSNFQVQGPALANLYSAAGMGVFADTNPNDRALDNGGTVYDINEFSDQGAIAGIASSESPEMPPTGNTLSAAAGSHGKITITTWVKLTGAALASSAQPRLLMFGSQGYDGNNVNQYSSSCTTKAIKG